jgi:hypothetical protein
MKYQIETITPAAADAMLDASVGSVQRRMMVTHVARLAAAMKRGEWRVTHQGIAIGSDGRIIDGQHRLAAIVRAGIPVEIMVMRDADPELFHVIDTGRGRSAGHILQIAGYPNAIALSTAIRLALTYDIVAGTTTTWTADVVRTSLSNDLILAVAGSPRGELLAGSLNEAIVIADGVDRSGSRIPLAVAIAVIRERTPEHAAALEEFLDRAGSGSMLPTGSPILALRRWLMLSYPTYPKYARGFATVAVVIKAWNDFLTGRDRALLIFRVGVERMPVPAGSDYVSTDSEPAAAREIDA